MVSCIQFSIQFDAVLYPIIFKNERKTIKKKKKKKNSDYDEFLYPSVKWHKDRIFIVLSLAKMLMILDNNISNRDSHF